MIVGSGMIATELQRHFPILHAAGVSDPTCTSDAEFQRDKERLKASLKRGPVVYFSSCAVYGHLTPYTKHKREMESLVREQGGAIIRLPTVAGKPGNPNTLLNTIYRKIHSGEPIQVWMNATRNIIDVADVARVTHQLILEGIWGQTVNLACDRDYYIPEIIADMEVITGKKANVILLDRGDSYDIDVCRIKHLIKFPEDYLIRTLRKYYE